MKKVATSLVLITGLLLTGCGGSQEKVADPSSLSDDDSDDYGAGEGEASEDSSDSSDSSDASSEDTSSDWQAGDSSESSDRSVDFPQQDEEGVGECRASGAKLSLVVDRKSVSLEDGRLRAKMDGPICKISMAIMRKDGLPTVEKGFRFSGTDRELRWNPVPRDQIEKIELRIDADDGGYQSVLMVPWYTKIPHKEVEFDTNRAIIRPTEVPSLEESYTKIKAVLDQNADKQLGTISLFIAGHTDTVGSQEHNMTLSRNRARSISAWFMKRGLCIPIAYEGFGETALKRMTEDEVDEQENRRVDYILSVEPPMTKEGRTPAWKWISKGC